MGFCVARTKNGSSRAYEVPAAVTVCSCIASSSADCVFGVARLISSASRTCANTGTRDERGQHVVDQRLMPDDHGAHFTADALERGGELFRGHLILLSVSAQPGQALEVPAGEAPGAAPRPG